MHETAPNILSIFSQILFIGFNLIKNHNFHYFDISTQHTLHGRRHAILIHGVAIKSLVEKLDQQISAKIFGLGSI